MALIVLLKGVLWLAVGGAISYLALCGLLLIGQRRLIFIPNRLLPVTPSALNLTHEEVWIPIGSDRLHSWWLPARASDTGFALLYLHGNAGNIGNHVGLANRFQQLGLSVLLVDYRGYGLSSGPFPSEVRLYEDALTAWQYLTQTRGLAPDRVLIFGHSIGGAVAIDLATQTPNAAGLIVENTFTSMHDMAVWQGYGNWVPVRWLLTQQFDSLRKMPTLQMPVLFIRGLADLTVPPDMSLRLYEAASEPKWIWSVPEGDHNSLAEIAGAAYDQRILQFLQAL